MNKQKQSWAWLDKQPRWVQTLIVIPIWAVAALTALIVVFPRFILALLLFLLGYLLWQHPEYQTWALSPVSNGLIIVVVIAFGLMLWRRE